MDYLITIIKEIGISDIIDILIITFVIYQIYRLVNFTRAIQLLKGVGVIVVVFFISNLLQLRVVNFMIRNMITLGALALVIIFQPELRRALEYMGRNQFGWYLFSDKSKMDEMHQIEAIVDAIHQLSNKKIGALLVIEGEIGLQDIIESGTYIDAKVDSALVQNIFMPNAPLHDGAAIIRRDRLEAAGCLLPLSSDRGVSRELGTRHRAALGMSSQSDALILVVSEETGTISIARNNKLERHLSIDDLREVLKEFYNGTDKRSLQEIIMGESNEKHI